jgi:hypothetical protein
MAEIDILRLYGLVIYMCCMCDEQEWPQERPEWSEIVLKPRPEDHQDKMDFQEDVEVRGRQYDPQVS